MFNQPGNSAEMRSIFGVLVCASARAGVRILVCLFAALLAWMPVAAQTEKQEVVQLEWPCEYTMALDPNLPGYYCDCTRSIPFYYGIDTVLTDSTWFKASLADVNAGLSAYWFSGSSITAKAYIICAQRDETMAFNIGKNRSYEIDMQELAQKISTSSAGQALSNITLKMLCIPDSGAGRFVCNPYGVSAQSTCAAPLPLYSGTLYTIDTNGMVLSYVETSSSSSLKRALRWVGKRGASVNVSITRGSCNGPVVASRTLADSTRIWVLDKTMLHSAYQTGDTLFFHFSSDGVGRVKMLSSVIINSVSVDTTLCEGMEFLLNDSLYTLPTQVSDSLYNDTARTLSVTHYNLSFSPPAIEYDTIRCHYDSLGFLYMGDRSKAVRAFGDYRFLVERVGLCTRQINLHVEQLWYEQLAQVDSTVCQGFRIKVNNQMYSKDTTFAVVTHNESTRFVTNYSLHFQEPELEYDTIRCYSDTFPFEYNKKSVTKAGTYTVTITKLNTCTRKIQLKVIEKWDTIQQTVDTTLCQGMAFEANNKVYTSTASVKVYTTLSDKRTKRLTTYRIRFVAPEMEYDTIGVHQEMMPYFYEGCEIVSYGDTLLSVVKEGRCTRLVNLHVVQLVTPVTYQTQELDTTLCEGRGLYLADTVYYQEGIYVDSSYVSDNVVLVTTYNLHVTPREIVWDTLRVMDEDFPIFYHDSSYIHRGPYVNNVLEEGCWKEYRLQLDTLPMQMRYDTILQENCQGKAWEVADTVVWESCEFSRNTRLAKDTTICTTYILVVTPAPILEDTIEVAADSLPFLYEEQQIGSLGSHTLYITRANDCDEEIHLEVVARETEEPNDTLDNALCDLEELPMVRKIWHNGAIYIERNGVRYTLLGLKVENVFVPQQKN